MKKTLPRTHDQGEPMDWQYINTTKREPFRKNKPRTELSPDERQRRYQERLCFNCGKPGHRASSHRQQQRGNYLKQQQVNATNAQPLPITKGRGGYNTVWQLNATKRGPNIIPDASKAYITTISEYNKVNTDSLDSEYNEIPLAENNNFIELSLEEVKKKLVALTR